MFVISGDMHVIAATRSFEELYRERHVPMVRLAYTIIRNQAVAEELVHEAFIKVSRAWDRLEQPAAYLRRAVVNESISHLRRRRLEQSQPIDAARTTLPPDIDETWTALGRLPAKQQAALALRFYADLSLDEVALSLNIPLGTAKSLIHRGLAALREVLEP